MLFQGSAWQDASVMGIVDQLLVVTGTTDEHQSLSQSDVGLS